MCFPVTNSGCGVLVIGPERATRVIRVVWLRLFPPLYYSCRRNNHAR
jgi:hypothetical protein